MMNIRVIAAIGLGVVAVGVAAVTLRPNQQETESKPLVPAQIVEQQPDSEIAAVSGDSEFQSMAVESDKPQECSLPKPPNSIGNTALTRNSFSQVMRLIALQKWQESGSCECFYNQISWDDVIIEAPKFERTDGVALQFDFPKLLTQADELSTLRMEACRE
jgi:hypothetical protein